MEKIQYLGLQIPIDDIKTWDFLCQAKNLKGVFQLETRSAGFTLAEVKPKNIEDLSICNALNRPGGMKFTKEVGEIRAGKMPVTYIDSCLEPFLKGSHSKLLYQESVLLIAQKLAGFKATESSVLLKSLGKKDLGKMMGLREKFINGMVGNGYRKEVAEYIFKWFEDFANYAFNKCIFEDEKVILSERGEIALKYIKRGDFILAYDVKTRQDVYVKVLNVYENSKVLYLVKFEDGSRIRCSLDHRFLCSDKKQHTIRQILDNHLTVATKGQGYFAIENVICCNCGEPRRTIDLEVDHPDHNFYCNNIVVSNSHSVGYSILGYISAYIKLHYPTQFFTSLLNYTQYEQSPLEEMFDIVSETPYFNLRVLPPSIKCLNENFVIERDGIRFPLKFIRSMGDAGFEKLQKLRDNQVTSLDGFLESAFSAGINSRSMEFLIAAGALDAFASREDLLFIYWFLSELPDETRNYFWTFQTGREITRQSAMEFLQYDKSVPGVHKRGESSGYFKTAVTRKRVISKMEENAKLIDSYKEKQTFARFMWENYVLGFSYHCKFNPNMVLFSEIDKQLGGQYSTYGFVYEQFTRSSKRGNPYIMLSLKLDERRTFMLFNKVADGARGSISEGDFVQLTFAKDQDKIDVTSIRNLTNQTKPYLFWERKKKIQEPVI